MENEISDGKEHDVTERLREHLKQNRARKTTTPAQTG
jgi:hypothetical protein